MNKGNVPSARRCDTYHSQCPEITQAKYTCEFQKVNEERVIRFDEKLDYLKNFKSYLFKSLFLM